MRWPKMRWLAVLGTCYALMAGPAGAVGFQWQSAPDPDDKPLEVALWYPSDAPVAPQTLGLSQQSVAVGGPIAGGLHPLIVISHGTGGWAGGHYDTALALAEAGFIVTAVTHTGDNYRDQSYAFTWRNFTDRPRHIARVIDYVLGAWPGRDHVDPARIGMFGHSAGGATVVLVTGGVLDLDLVAAFCPAHPDDWACAQIKQRGGARIAPPATPVVWVHDGRIKAAAAAAPAVGYGFTRAGLAAVTLPLQIWRAAEETIVVDEWNTAIVRRELPNPPDDRLVPGAGHFSFLAPCSAGLAAVAPEICRDPPGFDRAAFHQTFNQALIAFFEARL